MERENRRIRKTKKKRRKMRRSFDGTGTFSNDHLLVTLSLDGRFKGYHYLVRCREISTLARFNPRGDLIYVGTNRGNINIWDVQTKEVSPLSPLSVHSGRASTEN